jgi:hypothetical protein
MAYSADNLEQRYTRAQCCIASKVLDYARQLKSGNVCKEDFNKLYLANSILKRVGGYIKLEPGCIDEITLDSLFNNLESMLGGKFPPKN